MASLASVALTGAGFATLQQGKAPTDTYAVFAVSGTFTNAVFTFEQTFDGTNWLPVMATPSNTNVAVATNTTSAIGAYQVACPLAVGVRLNNASLGSGTMNVTAYSGSFVSIPAPPSAGPAGPAGGTTTIGANGTTIPALGLIGFSSTIGIAGGTTRTQAGATALGIFEVNRVDTSTAVTAGTTLGDGVKLVAGSPGLEIALINNTINNIQVYGTGADTINGVAAATGIPIPPGDVALFVCAVAGDWRVEAGVGSAGGLEAVLAADNIVAAGANQAAAFQLTACSNRVITATAGQGIKLPAATVGGINVYIQNHTGVPIQVYGNGTDTINDTAAATGVSQMNGSVTIFTTYGAGKWYSEGLASGYALTAGLGTIQFSDALTALGTTQGTGLPLTAAINTVSTVGSGTGVNLPASAPGLIVTVINTGLNALLVYPLQGATDTINGVAAAGGVALLPGTVASFNCTAAGAWTTQPGSTKAAAFNGNAATTNATATAAQVTGGVASVDLALTGTLAAGATLTTPTAAQIIAALHCPTVGTSYRLRVINQSAGAFVWTVAAGAGVTLTGTATIAQNTWREFVVTLSSISALTMQNCATGTFS